MYWELLIRYKVSDCMWFNSATSFQPPVYTMSCFISLYVEVLLPKCYVSTGIGPLPIVNVTVASPFCTQWEKPVFTSSDVGDVMYNVSLTGPGVLPFTITTTDCQHCPEFTPCQEYTITVTPFSTSPDYTGIRSTINYIAYGGKIQWVVSKTLLWAECWCWEHFYVTKC